MSIAITRKRKKLGAALLLLALAVLLFGYYVSAPDPKTPPAEPFESEAESTLGSAPEESAPALESISSSTSSFRPASLTDGADESTVAESEPALQEAELAHLNDVFLISLYPLFQYEFPLDREGRSAIDVFVASMPDGLSHEDLNAVSAMIQDQLRTSQAEDLAFIITHLYRLEQEEARMLSEGEPITTMEGQLEAQERLLRLREEWFGPELSERLFPGAEDTRDSVGVKPEESPPDGKSDEEPPDTLNEAQTELADIERAWERRYQAFLADKQVIERAGLDQSEKDQQVEALLRQHYMPQELEAARAFDQSRQ